MRSPSIKALRGAFKLDLGQARLIKQIASAADDPKDLEWTINAHCPATADYVRSMYSDPYHSRIWRVTVALHAINAILGTHGVEGLGPADESDGYAPPFEYLNTGDTYATTLIYKRATDNLYLGCWGNVVEGHPSW